jgi:glutaredoxin
MQLMASLSPPRRCAIHELAAGPDGTCALCVRERAGSVRPVTRSWLRDPLSWLAGLGVLLSLTGFAWAAAPLGALGARLFTETEPIVREPPSAAPAAATPSAAHAVGQPSQPVVTAQTPLDLDDPPEPRAAQPSAAAGSSESEATRAQHLHEQAEQDRKRHAAVQAQLRGHELAGARRNVLITMYSTSWCGVCTKARAYMREQDIPFTDFDVDHDEAAKGRALTLNPGGSVPTMTVDDQLLIGFSPGALETRIERAARVRSMR